MGVRDLLRLPRPQAIVVRHSMTFLLAPVVQRVKSEASGVGVG